MPKLAPTLDEIKAELRIDFNHDDTLIQSYINSSAMHVGRCIHWIAYDKGVAGEDVTIDASRFCGTQAIRIPRRGVSVDYLLPDTAPCRLYYLNADDEDESVDLFTLPHIGDGEAYLDAGIDINRHIVYLKPATTWDFIGTNNVECRLNLKPGDAPADILNIMSKLAVDMYRYNGVASEPMRTAVDRELNPWSYDIGQY